MRMHLVPLVAVMVSVLFGCEGDSSSSSQSANTPADVEGTWSVAAGDVIDKTGPVTTMEIGGPYIFAKGVVTRAARGKGTYTTGPSESADCTIRFHIELPDFPGFKVEFEGVVNGSAMSGEVTATWPPPQSWSIRAKFTAAKIER